MKKILLLLTFYSILTLINACGVSSPKVKVSDEKPYSTVTDTVVIMQIRENIRAIPNGEIIGKSMIGEKFEIIGKRGNWIELKNPDFKKGYMWAPSIGFPKIDLFALKTWFDVKMEAFFHLTQYYNLLGPPEKTEDYFNMKKYVFRDLGFGFTSEDIMDQSGKVKTETLQKGVDIVVDKDGRVKEVHLDLKKNIEKLSEMSSLLKVNMGIPSTQDKTRITWKNKLGLSEIRLLRSEFDVEDFNQIVLIQ